MVADALGQGSFPENKTHLMNTRRIILDIEHSTRSTGKQNPGWVSRTTSQSLNTKLGHQQSMCSSQSQEIIDCLMPHICHNAHQDGGSSAVGKSNVLSFVLTSTDGREQAQNTVLYFCLWNITFPVDLQVQENLYNVALSWPTCERNWNGCWVGLFTGPAKVEILYSVAKHTKVSRGKNRMVLEESRKTLINIWQVVKDKYGISKQWRKI